jgi:hypothetical protein
MAAKKSTPSKTSFVKSLPATMPAKEVIARGKAAGISLTEMYIYSIRSKSKAKAGARAPRGAATSKRATSMGARTRSGGSDLQRLVERIVEEQVMKALRAKIGELLG